VKTPECSTITEEKYSLAGEGPLSSQQNIFLKQTVEELVKKAGLHRAPELSISKNERFASVNVFQNRINLGEHLLSLWQQGQFSDKDIEATLAHEVGHLMDFRRDSGSSNFRNLLIESLWFSSGVVPIVTYILNPSMTWLLVSVFLALGWALSLPWIVRLVEVRIEFEADRKAAMHLVAPQQLADALVRIGSFGKPSKTLGFTAKMAFLAGTMTHPSFKARVRSLQNL
jgi:Zn-dependent protease with chaperone function